MARKKKPQKNSSPKADTPTKGKPRKAKTSTPDFSADVPQTPPVGWEKSNTSICPYSDEVLRTAGLIIKDNFASPLFHFSLHGGQVGTLLNVLHDETEKIIGSQTWEDVDSDTTQLLHRALAIRGCLKLAFLHCERNELSFMLGQILQAATLWITRDERYTRFRSDLELRDLKVKRRASTAGLQGGPKAKSEQAARQREEAEAMAEKIRDAASRNLTNHQLAARIKEKMPKLPQRTSTIKRWFDRVWPPRQ